MKKLQLTEAEMQFVGWTSHKTGETLIDMVDAMGLTSLEWIELNKNHIVSLDKDDIIEITDYFIVESEKEKYLQERENRNIGIDIVKLKKLKYKTQK